MAKTEFGYSCTAASLRVKGAHVHCWHLQTALYEHHECFVCCQCEASTKNPVTTEGPCDSNEPLRRDNDE